MGLSISESVPDHSRFWRFRQLFEEKSLMAPLSETINVQLAEQGLYIQSGEVSIIDKVNGLARENALEYASVIEAKQCRPNKRKGGSTTQDPEAALKVKAGSDGKRKSTYGFKAHINVPMKMA
jgi:IS5 family transposase